jgi:protein TonB
MSTTLSRITAATTLGAAMTTAVLLLMQSLIESDQPSLEDPPPGATLAFLPRIVETPPDIDTDKLEVPPPPLPPPPHPKVVDRDLPTRGIEVGFTVPETPPITGPVSGPLSDGDALPVVKVRPEYPIRAAEQGIEGYVLVQFTIDELGRVIDVEVIESQPRGTFDRAALKAVERFRYKPRVVNGQATPVSGVRHLVTFELSS